MIMRMGFRERVGLFDGDVWIGKWGLKRTWRFLLRTDRLGLLEMDAASLLVRFR